MEKRSNPGRKTAAKKNKRKQDLRARMGPPKDITVDYKDVALLQKFTTARGKMHSRTRSGLTARSQRALAIAIKRARFMALMPFVGR